MDTLSKIVLILYCLLSIPFFSCLLFKGKFRNLKTLNFGVAAFIAVPIVALLTAIMGVETLNQIYYIQIASNIVSVIDLVGFICLFAGGVKKGDPFMLVGGLMLFSLLVSKELNESNLGSILLSYLSFSVGFAKFLETGKLDKDFV